MSVKALEFGGFTERILCQPMEDMMRNKQALDDILFLIEMIDDLGTLDEGEALYAVRAEYDRDHGRDEMARQNDGKMWRAQTVRDRLGELREWVKRQEKFWAEGDE